MAGRKEKQPLLSGGSNSDSESDGVTYSSCDEVSAPLLSASINLLDEDKAVIHRAIGREPLPIQAVYKRRWYILTLFSLFGFTQSAVWNTWGPISTSASQVFGWSDTTVAWLSNWGCISFVAAGLFYPWLLHVKGLRVATVSSMFLIAAGSTLRVISHEPLTATILIHFGQMLNGLAGPIAMCAIPSVSALWFPPTERVTATAITNSINTFGVALAFILGPLLVSEAPSEPTNTTGFPSPDLNHSTPSFEYLLSSAPTNNSTSIEAERRGIMHYMYYECGWSWILFLAIVCYFPSTPPHPPCVSAAMEREKYWPGLWSLRNKGFFLTMAFVYAISIGVLTVWGSVLNVNLQPFGVKEKESGWIGFYSTLGGCIAPLFIMRFADLFARHMKFYILFMYFVGTGCFIAFTLMLIDVIPFTTLRLYALVIGGTTLINAAVPMMFEVACELAYPTSEGAANGILTFLNNVVGLVYLAVFSVPHVGTMWMNWGLIGSTAVCIPLIAFLRGRFNRLEVDEGVHPEVVVEQEVEVERPEISLEDEGS